VAFTEPKTWDALEVVTAAGFNTYIKNNLIDLDSRFKTGTTVTADRTTLSTTGGAEEVLHTYTIAANTLNTNQDTLHLAAYGSGDSSTNARTIRVRLGTTGSPLTGTICASVNSNVQFVDDWFIEVFISRIASNSQGIMGKGFIVNGGTNSPTTARDFMTLATASLTDSSAMALVITGDGVIAGEVQYRQSYLQTLKA
jgi:hypothetical protein